MGGAGGSQQGMKCAGLGQWGWRDVGRWGPSVLSPFRTSGSPRQSSTHSLLLFLHPVLGLPQSRDSVKQFTHERKVLKKW